MYKILIVLICSCLTINAQSNKVKRSVSASTYVQSESNKYKLIGTIGQNAIGLSTKNKVKISAGYWGWISRWAVLGTDDNNIIPNQFKISPAYPNPFNPSAKIDMEIPDAGIVQITIYDILGRIVLDHKNEFPSAGKYQFVWNPRSISGHSLATGTYIVTIRHQNNINTQITISLFIIF